MPGRQLSHDERRLLNLWNQPPPTLARPFLESIGVAGGLRGIVALLVPFRFPISVLCGKNGVGKSTVLALAALAFHSPAGWYIPNWLYQPRSKAKDRSYYIFGDFFARAIDEQSFDEVSVRWTYRGSSPPAEPVEFTKSPRRWGRYNIRPEREVVFSTIRRLVPAHEVPGVRSAFGNKPDYVDVINMSENALNDFSYIMGRNYSFAEIQEARRHSLQRVRTRASFTGFNMGGGESWVMNFLHTIDVLPQGSLVVVEDIDAGLHVQAQVHLMKVLVKICLRRHIQIVCSTHSEALLDAVPRRARILLRTIGDEHEAYDSPSTRLAVYEMSGQVQPELTIYCEDLSAKTLIEEALPHDLRVRCSVREVGNGATVVRQGVSHLRSGYKMEAVCVLDGDCLGSSVKRWVAAEAGPYEDHRPEWMLLPGGLAPEKWIVEQLRERIYRNRFADEFGCTIGQANEMIEAVRAELDHHNLGHRLHEMTGMDTEDCIRRAMRSVVAVHPQLEELRAMVRLRLD